MHTRYSDEVGILPYVYVELNISQFINILHQIKLYDPQIWLGALDNYHKQGHLNWD